MDTTNFKGEEFKCRCGCGLEAKDALILAMQTVRDAWKRPMIVNSGARCPAYNAKIGGAPNSAHIYGLAADIADEDGALKDWMILGRLVTYGLWMEEPSATKGWAHLQIRPATNRIFVP